MAHKLVGALPAIGALIGYLVYWPYLWLFVDMIDVPYRVESYKTEEVVVTPDPSTDVVVDAFGKEFSVPVCKSYRYERPVLSDGLLVPEVHTEHRMGRGKPIVRTLGQRPIYSTDVTVKCVARPVPVVSFDPLGGFPKVLSGAVDHVKAEVKVTVKNREFVGYVTETELVFEKPFEPLDFVPIASLAGAWISLLYLLRSSNEDPEHRRSEHLVGRDR